MATLDNRPQLADVLTELQTLPASLLAKLDPAGNSTYPVIADQLAKSISHIEDQATTAFNCTWPSAFGVEWDTNEDYDYVQQPVSPTSTYALLADGTKVGFEPHDGNGTNQLVCRRRPVLDVALVQVRTPILGYTRVYTRDELKIYPREGVLKVFTYKLAVEQALLQTVDYQAWGSLFPPLPKCVEVAYCYGFPLYNAAFTGTDAITGAPIVAAPATSFDAGHSWRAGDCRDQVLSNWLANLQEAAVCDCCAQILGRVAGLARGLVQSVAFDGYSRGLAQAPFASEVQMFVQRRDELLGRRGRRFSISTVGGH